uniref:CAAX prenyl protease 2/Lysostaphin resistance protein A-like domain-containing protein n=1 Tax=Chlorobium chlorochromatii (strain CaD3) TaxID=340177 RepID=Q3AQJ8_CHLCH
MQHFSQSKRRFVLFWHTTAALAVLMLLYPLIGNFFIAWFVGAELERGALLQPEMLRSFVPSLRIVQMVGQVLLLAFPALLLAGWQRGCRAPWSPEVRMWMGLQPPFDGGVLVAGAGGIILLQPLLSLIAALQERYLWPALGEAGREVLQQQESMELFLRTIADAHSLPEALFVLAVLAVTPAITEELLFRGYVQRNYMQVLSPAMAIVLSGLLFAFFHLSAANLLPLALLGCYIGYIYYCSGNLFVPMVAHFTNNALALIVLWFTPQEHTMAMQAERIALLLSPAWWFLVVGCTLLFWRLMRWLTDRIVRH